MILTTIYPHQAYTKTNETPYPQQLPFHRYGLGIRFLREEYATSYAKLDLPLPLPANGDADTDLSTGPQEGLPIYTSPPGSQEERFSALRLPGGKCPICSDPFGAGATLMLCYHCNAAVHVRCLAARMLREAGEHGCEVIPSEGVCWVPACRRRLLWSRLVKGVQVYRPKVSSSSELEQTLGDGPVDGGTEIDRGPLVWRVDDSSDDDDDDGDSDEDCSECGSDLAAREEGVAGWSSGAASRDLVSDIEEGEEEDEDDDDSFWKLDGGGPGCSQTRAGGPGKTRATRPISSCGEMSGRDCRTSSLLAVGRAEVGKTLGRGYASFVDTTNDRCDSEDSCGGGDQERETENSPLMLPLLERLRQRRLHGN